jgi:hypothetical protein
VLISRILGAASVGTYLLAMCLPAIAAKSYYKTYLLHGWEVTYMCAILSFAPSMNLVEKASFIVGTLSNVLFLFGIGIGLFRNDQRGRRSGCDTKIEFLSACIFQHCSEWL